MTPQNSDFPVEGKPTEQTTSQQEHVLQALRRLRDETVSPPEGFDIKKLASESLDAFWRERERLEASEQERRVTPAFAMGFELTDFSLRMRDWATRNRTREFATEVTAVLVPIMLCLLFINRPLPSSSNMIILYTAVFSLITLSTLGWVIYSFWREGGVRSKWQTYLRQCSGAIAAGAMVCMTFLAQNSEQQKQVRTILQDTTEAYAASQLLGFSLDSLECKAESGNFKELPSQEAELPQMADSIPSIKIVMRKESAEEIEYEAISSLLRGKLFARLNSKVGQSAVVAYSDNDVLLFSRAVNKPEKP